MIFSIGDEKTFRREYRNAEMYAPRNNPAVPAINWPVIGPL